MNDIDKSFSLFVAFWLNTACLGRNLFMTMTVEMIETRITVEHIFLHIKLHFYFSNCNGFNVSKFHNAILAE